MLDAYSSTIIFIALGGIFAFSFYAVLVAGELSLGQAGFASLAAFISVAVVPTPTEAGPIRSLLLAIVVGVAVGAAASIVLGLPTMRLRGVFLAIATLAFAEAVRIILLNGSWTGGAQGLSVPKVVTPLIAWVALAVVAYWFWRQGPSRYGRALAAIREDELAARAMGIDVPRHRLGAFITSGMVAGLYGVLWAYTLRLFAPDDFGFSAAIDGLVTAVLGGSTMAIGPILGSGFQTAIPEVQRAVGLEAGWIRPFLSSLLLLVVILFLPGGLASLFPRRWRVGRQVQAAERAAEVLEPHLAGRVHPSEGEAVVELAAVGKEYGGVHAVRAVDLRVDAGEVLGLIGPNGAGKTTLVNMISGLVPPSHGTLRVLGVTPGRDPVHRVAAAGVSRTFQHSKLFPRLSALENVLIGAHLVSRQTLWRRMLWLPSARRDEEDALGHSIRCLRRVGLGEAAGEAAASLSYGDQRRLEIARALAADPGLMILDEPAAGMNPVEARKLSELIASLARSGLTIMLIEHNVGMVLRTCTRIVVLNFGEVIATGTPEEIKHDQGVIDAYLGSEHPVLEADDPAERADHA